MDKIYSRSRIRVPKIIYSGGNTNRNYNKIVKILAIIIIAILVMVNILNAIDPIFDIACIKKAESIVTIEVNRITTLNIDKYQDYEMVSIKEDESGNIQLLQINTRPLNNMISDITNDIQVSLNDNEILNSYIPFGSITGIKWISGVGPKVPLEIALSGTIQTKIRNEFSDAGINQTIHRLYLDITCDISILTPYENMDTQVTNELILSENIIVGKVPDVYMNTKE